MWSKTYGGSQEDVFEDLLITPDGEYLAFGRSLSYGSSRGKFYLVKTDSEGNQQWFKTYGHDDYTHGFAIAPTNDGGYVLAGNSTETDAWLDFRLTKIDENGNEQWTKFYGRTQDDTALDVKQTSDGGYILSGVTGGWSSDSQIWVVKTDSEGNKQWDRALGNSTPESESWDRGHSFEELDDGSFIIVGNTYNGNNKQDIALIKLDSQGNEIWMQLYGGSESDLGHDFVVLDNGNLAIAGTTLSSGEGKGDANLIITDSDGNKLKSQT